MAETFVFQAEINQLLSLIINAFYSDRDVFLRELVSNASDALDKQRYTMLTSSSPADPGQLRIRISFDTDAKTFTIEDNGIGMSREELVENLGTIAKSGTKQFMEALSSKATEGAPNTNLIGQFGMGFYSAFLVASNVSVYSKTDVDDTVHVWQSSASGTFEISTVPNQDQTFERGTRIVLYLKEDCEDYLSEAKVREILKKHSEFVAFPIEMLVEEEQRVEEAEDADADKDADADEDADADKDGEIEVDTADTDSKKAVFVKVKAWKQINTNKAIWARRPDDIGEEEYNMFYRGFSNDWQAPLCHIHFTAEGQFEFHGLFFVPQYPSFSPDGRNTNTKNNISLYVNRVFVTNNVQNDVLPDYLGFVRGLVDSEDLPLNISREMLQKSKVLSVIKRTSVKKIIDGLVDLARTKPEEYANFWRVYGKFVRWGISDDQKNKDRLAELLRFQSTKSDNKLISLADYVERMKPEQETIHYITGESKESVQTSVFLDSFKREDVEVLYMTDAIDEYMVQSLQEYSGKKLVSVSAPQDTVADTTNDSSDAHKKLCDRIKEIVGDAVTRVVVTKRLVDAPCAIVTEGYGPSANMERILKAQAIQSDHPLMQQTYKASRVMEINVDHPLVMSMLECVESDDKKQVFEQRVRVMHGAGLLASGFALDNPAAFARMVTANMMTMVTD